MKPLSKHYPAPWPERLCHAAATEGSQATRDAAIDDVIRRMAALGLCARLSPHGIEQHMHKTAPASE